MINKKRFKLKTITLFRALIFCMSFPTFLYSQYVDYGDIVLMPQVAISGKFSLSAFTDPTVNLWSVDVLNTYDGEEPLDLRLEVKMFWTPFSSTQQLSNIEEVAFWGVTKPIECIGGPSSARIRVKPTTISR